MTSKNQVPHHGADLEGVPLLTQLPLRRSRLSSVAPPPPTDRRFFQNFMTPLLNMVLVLSRHVTSHGFWSQNCMILRLTSPQHRQPLASSALTVHSPPRLHLHLLTNLAASQPKG